MKHFLACTITKKRTFLLLLLLPAAAGHAHTINYALEQAPAGQVWWFYLKMGVAHIVPYGLDHILFVVSLCLLPARWKSILWQATAFTAAHSITLALSAKGILQLPSQVVEPVIALSIVYVAAENLLRTSLRPERVLLIFLFGLVHGLGFAGALKETGLPRNRFFEAVAAFNIGVELGQLFVIALVLGLFVLPFRSKDGYRKWVLYPFSVVTILVAGFWTWQRVSGH